MLLIRHDSIPASGTPGAFSGGLATPSRGASEVSIIRQHMEVGVSGPLHYHDREEVIMLLTGAVKVISGEEQVNLNAGDALIIPASTHHKMENIGQELAQWLIVSPSGVRFFGPTGEEIVPEWAK